VSNPSAEKGDNENRRDPLRSSLSPFSALELKANKKISMKKILTTFLFFLSLNAFSQADDPADGDAQVPVDGGISILLAVGAAYAGRRLNRSSRL
jgi:hypothetical protein